MNVFEYISVQVSVSDGMIPRRDADTLGPSLTISMGDLQGDLLWVESKEGRTLLPSPYTAPGLGPETRG
eukprot:3074802-Prorocentrum_lima.AAC.1